MSVDLPPTPKPSSSQTRTAFISSMAALVDWFYTAIAQFNTDITALNFNSTNGTSSTSVAIGTGSKSITGNTSKSWAKGMTLKIAYDASNWMIGEVSSYDTGTGALVMNIRRVLGSGTYASWTISLASDDAGVGDHEIVVHTPNGYGSTNTKIKRYTTAHKSAGTDITYTDDASLGASFQINASGKYLIERADDYGGTVGFFGVSNNTSAGTTAVVSLAFSERLIVGEVTSQSGMNVLSTIAELSNGDVLRPHDSAVLNAAGDKYYMKVKRVG